MNGRVLLSVRNVSFRRMADANLTLDDITFELSEGERISLLGPNGCGKTTLLNLVIGRLIPTNGSITMPPLRIGYVDQELILFPWMSIKSNILFGLRRRNVPKEIQRQMLSDLRNRLNIEDLLDKFPVRLSGGMRQRAVLARTLIDSPQLLLLDEPFSALDSSTRKEFHELFDKMDTPFILVTHDPHEAVRISSKIIPLTGGNGKPGKIITELSVDRDNAASRSRTENTLKTLLAYGSGEFVSLEAALKAEDIATPNDTIIVIAQGLERISYNDPLFTMICGNISRGVRHQLYLPATSASASQIFEQLVTCTGRSMEIITRLLDIRTILPDQALPCEYWIIEREGKVVTGWQFPIPYDHRYAFALRDDSAYQAFKAQVADKHET